MSGPQVLRLSALVLAAASGPAAVQARAAAPPDGRARAQALVSSLHNKDGRARAAGAARLGKLGLFAEEAAGELCLLLFDGDQGVLLEAARALGRIRLPGSVPFLLAVLPNSKGELRRAVLSSLG